MQAKKQAPKNPTRKPETPEFSPFDPEPLPILDPRKIASFQALAIDWEELEQNHRIDYFLSNLKKK